jgi:cytochrome c oxidase subunit IV
MTSTRAPTRAVLVGSFVALLLLLTASAAAALAPLPPVWKLFVALGVAALKCLLIFTVFMQLKYQRGLVRAFALAGFFWLAIIMTLTFADYLTRGPG